VKIDSEALFRPEHARLRCIRGKKIVHTSCADPGSRHVLDPIRVLRYTVGTKSARHAPYMG
jgi:hypothetical protein